MGWQETQRRDQEVREAAYRMGYVDAIDGLPEDPDRRPCWRGRPSVSIIRAIA